MRSLKDFMDVSIPHLKVSDYLFSSSGTIFLIVRSDVPNIGKSNVQLVGLCTGQPYLHPLATPYPYHISAEQAKMLGITADWYLLTKEEAWQRLLDDATAR